MVWGLNCITMVWKHSVPKVAHQPVKNYKLSESINTYTCWQKCCHHTPNTLILQAFMTIWYFPANDLSPLTTGLMIYTYIHWQIAYKNRKHNHKNMQLLLHMHKTSHWILTSIQLWSCWHSVLTTTKHTLEHMITSCFKSFPVFLAPTQTCEHFIQLWNKKRTLTNSSWFRTKCEQIKLGKDASIEL